MQRRKSEGRYPRSEPNPNPEPSNIFGLTASGLNSDLGFISGFAFRVSALSTLPDQHELVTRLYETGRFVFDSSFTWPMTIRLSTALHMS